MPTDKPLQSKKAKSISTRLSEDDPKVASLNFILSDGGFLTVEIPRYVLKRFLAQAQKLNP